MRAANGFALEDGNDVDVYRDDAGGSGRGRGRVHDGDDEDTPDSDSAEGCVLVNSKMHNFRSFGDFEFRTNLKS